ncbi:FtsK/SpoIIIE domain-containing protein [Streptomyces sp. NPDC101158]|uniref:FtsK/SpoIIIE domain-containing protein n=1 Tax=Streptomyces sp. NPDC101158 TaxID=3366117 RepID=UPI00381C35F1
MSKRAKSEEDGYGQLAGAIGALAIAAGCLAAVKDKLGLSWPATVLVSAGALVALGYLAWRVRTAVKRWWASDGTPPATKATTTAQHPEASAATPLEGVFPGQAEAIAPVHPELTAALVTAGAIGRDEVIRAADVTIIQATTGTLYEFLVPRGRTYEDVEKRLGTLAGVLGVTRLHLKLERSRDTERRVRLLKLDEPPFTQPFPAPTRREIETFAGIPLGHDVTGELVGVPTLDKASLLVAGMTQMGKTTLINGLITCLLIAYGEFELYLLDGKFCGLTRFEKTAVRYESSDSPAVFESMVDELNERADARYAKSRDAIRNRQPAPAFKPVIFIVDEAADFFANDGSKEGAEQARRIADKTRSLVAKALESKISTVLMTQRPATNAIPVMVRDQFLYRLCLYVASAGTAKVALGDTYFETVAPINPALLDAEIKGQGVLFVNGRSTLIRGFNFSDEFIWRVVDEVHARQHTEAESAVLTPLEQAIEMMRTKGADFLPTAVLAPALGIEEEDAAEQGKRLGALLGGNVQRYRRGSTRGYLLADLEAAVRAGS